MSVTKCTMVFEQNQYGWTESYFLNTASATLDDEFNALYTLSEKRILCSGQQTKITWLKVSQEGVSRDVRLYNFQAATGVTRDGYAGKNSDARFAAALIRRQDSTRTKTSNLLLRGIWDDVILAGELAPLDPTWAGVFAAFVGTYRSLNFGFPAKKELTSTSALVNTVTADAFNHLQVTTFIPIFTAPEVNAKMQVYISGVQGAATLNGLQTVRVTATNAFTTVNRLPALPYAGEGKVSVNRREWVRVETMTPLRCVKRATGRPLYLSRGRAPVRKLV